MAYVQTYPLLARGGGGGGGEGAEGGSQQNFIQRGSSPKVQILTLLLIPFLTEKKTVLYTFRRRWYPFHIPTVETL